MEDVDEAGEERGDVEMFVEPRGRSTPTSSGGAPRIIMGFDEDYEENTFHHSVMCLFRAIFRPF